MNNYVVYGLGISGVSTAKFLQKNNCSIVATDDNLTALTKLNEIDPDIKTSSPENLFNNYHFNSETIISFSPGIPLYYPKQHRIVEICKKTGAKLSCDLEIFYNFNQGNNYVGITGTNGKSTATALTGYIFDELKIPAKIGGNIGVPCFDLPINQSSFNYVFEVSSYQLDLISNLKFDIACLLNITPDHIDRHGSLENYILAKKRIFLNQDENSFAIINIDNQNSLNVLKSLEVDKSFKSKIVKISTQKILEDGISLVQNQLFVNLFSQKFKFDINPFIKGEHNSQNIACAFSIICCHIFKFGEYNSTNIEKIVKIIEGFKGLRHRLQLIRKIEKVSFINDSKATNAESTENALKTYDNIFWIVGGKPKEGGINSLKSYFKKIKKAYLIGESSADFAKVFDDNDVDYIKADNLENAFKLSYDDAKRSDLNEVNIILSPACASFDQWKNFEQRGDFFCKLVNEI